MANAVFTVGARGSKLSVAQTQAAMDFLARAFPGTRWRFTAVETPGDRDLTTPLEQSAPDFFTRDLDDAVRAGRIDCAIHSAKDLPGYSAAGVPMVAEGLDWFWLPNRADPQDCWVTRRGEAPRNRASFRIGVSSARRRAYAQAALPKAKLLPIRGAIDARLAQLKDGRYDAVLMAQAGLERLYPAGLPDFEVHPIPLSDLPPPEAQGYLAVTFRAGDTRFMALRERFAKAVRFVSAGVGDAALCTLAGLRDLCDADVVLYDALMGDLADFKARILREAGRLPTFVPVGKRCGAHSMKQPEITELICDEARKGRRVVRLKGGDAGLFGRLAEETDALTALGIPFVVRPGVSALTAATTGTGLLLTRRGESRGFTALTPRSTGQETPLVMFMAVQVAAEEAKKLMAAGCAQQTPCAIVFDAAGPREKVWQGTLGGLRQEQPELKALAAEGCPGLFIVGQVAAHLWPKLGWLKGARVLVTASEAVQTRVARTVEDRGGKPIAWPLISLEPRPIVYDEKYDAIVLTSPSSVRLFFAACPIDRRSLPAFFTCGAGTDAELRKYGLVSDVMPESDFSARGLMALFAGGKKLKGKRILRLRSAKAGPDVANALRKAGAKVDDVVLYDNVPMVAPAAKPADRRANCAMLPSFDAVHFASASAVEVFLAAYGAAALAGKTVYVMGEPTRAALPSNWSKRAQLLETWR